MLADLIYEKGEYYTSINSPENTSSNCYKKAFLIYLFLKENATLNYSLDMHYKLEILSKMGFLKTYWALPSYRRVSPPAGGYNLFYLCLDKKGFSLQSLTQM
jgi:hypothetical protein